jgi:hypothetical protein
MFNLNLRKWFSDNGVNVSSGLRSGLANRTSSGDISLREIVKRTPCVVDVTLSTIFVVADPPIPDGTSAVKTQPQAAFGGGGVPYYLWTAFYIIDGSTISIDDSGSVQGNCRVQPSFGDHGNLGDPTVTPLPNGGEQRTWHIPPDTIGRRTATVLPIPIQSSAIQGFLNEVTWPANFGMIAVLMEEGGNTPGHAVAKGHAAFTADIEAGLNNLLRDLGPSKTAITQGDIDQLKTQVSNQVRDAITNDLSLDEKLTIEFQGGADFEGGAPVWTWDQNTVYRSGSEQELKMALRDSNITGHLSIRAM